MAVSSGVAQVGTFGLTVAGGLFFGPVGAAAGALLGGFLFGSSGPDIEGPRLGDLNVSASTYGGVIPVGFGVQKVAGTMIWATDIEEEKRTSTTGGGILGGGQDVIEYVYFANFAVAFGEGPAVDILRLWAGETLIFDRRNSIAGENEAAPMPGGLGLLVGNPQYKYKIHLGTEDQEPDGLIVAKISGTAGGIFGGLIGPDGEESHEADAVPAHRGMVYVVFDRLPLAEWNNQIPPITAEIAWSGDRPATVRNASFALHDGTTFSRSDLAVDFARGYIYVGMSDDQGVHRLRISDMQEDLHISNAHAGGTFSPEAVDSRGNVYGTTLGAIRKFDGSSYKVVATTGDGNNPVIDIMWGYTPTGWRFDLLLEMGQFGECYVRVADLPVFFTNIGALSLLMDEFDLSARRHGPVAGRAAVGSCEGWFIGNQSVSGESSVELPILHVEVLIPLALSIVDVHGLSEQSAITATRISLTSADFGLTGNLGGLSTPAYDEQNDRLIFMAGFDEGPDLIVAYSRSDSIVWTQLRISDEDLPERARYTGGKIYTYGNGISYVRDAADGTLLESHGSFAATPGIGGRVLFDERSTTYYMTGDSTVHQVVAHRSIPDAMPLADIVTALCLRAGLTEDDLDVSELTDGVRGYALARQISVRGGLEMLAAVYMFDAVESDHLLKFKMRGRSPSRVIAESDLVPVNDRREAYIETRAQEVDLPLRFTVIYQDLDRDADIGSQYAKRIARPSSAMHSRNEATFDVPLTLTAAEAKGLALRQLHSAWLERMGHEWHLPWSHIDLEPADVVQIALADGTLFTLRVLEAEIGANLELAWKTVLEESSSYSAVPVTRGGLGFRRASTVYGSEANLFAMDAPLLTDADDVGRVMTGLYWAAGAYGTPWPSCVLFQSVDGIFFAAADTVFAAVGWGFVVSALGDTETPFQTDLENTLEVAFGGTAAPESVTVAEMLAGANRAALIRADGTAEIIHFRDVAEGDNGTHVLSTLLRGRRGTEVFVSGHQSGEVLVLLDDAVSRRLMALDLIGTTVYLAAVGRGGLLQDAKTRRLEFAGNDLKPYAPVHLASAGDWESDLTLSWVRRTRVGGELKDGVGTVLLAEDAEAYELEITGPDDDIRRTVTGLTSASFTYTAAMQAEDFTEGYPATAFRVYQVSAQAGRGFASEDFTFSFAPVLETVGENITEGLAGAANTEFEGGFVLAQRYTAPGGRLLTISAYLAGGSGNMRVGIYADSAGEPGALLGESGDKAVSSTSSGHWEEFVIPGAIALSEGTQYWLCGHASADLDSRGSLDGANVNDRRRLVTLSFASGLPDPFGVASSYVNTRGLRMLVWTNP